MQDEVNPDGVIAHDLDERGVDRLETFAPTFATMAGDQNALPTVVHQPLGGKVRLGGDQRVDPGVAGHVHFAPEALCPQVRGGPFRRCEQQVGASVDRGAIFLLGPGEERIVSPQSCLDMCDGNLGEGAGERCSKRARGIACTTTRSGAGLNSGSMAAVAMRTCRCGFSSPGQPRRTAGYASSPNSAGSRAAC